MANNFIEFMDAALGDNVLLDQFKAEFNRLYDDQGNPRVANADQALSDWFAQKGYTVPKGQCKKLKDPVLKAKGKVVPEY
jgi:hypothetical protein